MKNRDYMRAHSRALTALAAHYRAEYRRAYQQQVAAGDPPYLAQARARQKLMRRHPRKFARLFRGERHEEGGA